MSNEDNYSQASYFQDVKGIALEIRSERKEQGEDFDEHQAVHESVDGSAWVIYYSHAPKVLEYSDNDCAIFEEMGPQSFDSWSDAHQAGAYYAMVRDVYDALSELPEVETCMLCDASYDETEDHDCPEEDDEDGEEADWNL